MSITEPNVTLTFRVIVPMDKPDSLNLRDEIIAALKPLGIRVSSISPSSVVRMMVDQSALAARVIPEQLRSEISVDGGLIPKPYRREGETDVFRIPVHFIGSRPQVCPWGGKDALPGALDACPIHGELKPLCEVNPDHLMAMVPAVGHVSTTADPATPACRECASGVVLSARMT